MPSDLAGRLQAMAPLRNVLVHVYWKIDYGRIFDVIQTDLPDLRAFASAMAKLI